MLRIRRGSSPTISSELLLGTALLFGAALVVAVIAAVLVLPSLPSAGTATLFVTALLLADLAILFLFLRYLLERDLFGPLRDIGRHAERISGGEYEHRIPSTGRDELDRLVRSVNIMARRLIHEQKLLEENVRSLERTNRELVDTTDELIRTARMASVGTLAAGVAHEVGNPLGALRGSLEVARRRLDSGGDSAEALDVALEEAHRIDQIVRSVLQFARSEPGEGEWTDLSVGAAVRSAVDLLERRGVLEGVRVDLREVGAMPHVRVRPQLLEQILVNLVMNAAQAGRWRAGTVARHVAAVPAGSSDAGDRKGGEGDARNTGESASEGAGVEIVVRTDPGARSMPPRRRVGDPPGTDYSHRRRIARLREGAPAGPSMGRGPDVSVEVLDRGPGIDEADLDRVFDPFFTTKAPGEGTGMGLAITARIVEELSGTLEAENRPGGGACFRLRLPGVADAGPAGSGGDER